MKRYNFRKLDIGIITLIILSFSIISFYNINDYGRTWDMDAHHIQVNTYFDFFKGNGLNISKFTDDLTISRAINKDNITLRYTNNDNIFYYGGLSDIIGGGFSKIFYEKLGWLDLVHSYFIHVIIFISFTILLVYLFTLANYGRLTAIISSLSLILFPRVIGHINNFKDIPVMFFTTLSIITFWKAITSNKWYWFVIAGISLGLSASVKIPMTAIFTFIILLAWYLIINRDKLKYLKDKRILQIPLTSLSLIIYPIVAVIAWFLTSPFYWTSIDEIKKRLFYAIKWFAGNLPNMTYYMGKSFRGIYAPWHYPFVMLFITTPLSILILASLGIYVAIKHTLKSTNKASSLILLWFFIPLIKFSLPGVLKYTGIRLFLDVVPALCILSGIGFVFIYRKLSKKLSKRVITLIAIISILLIFLPILFTLIEIHPYEALYFNSLVGGIKGANENFEVEYWGSTYQEGVKWINNNIEENATLIVPIGGFIANYYPIRDNVELIESDNLGRSNISLIKYEGKPIYIMYTVYNSIIKYYPGEDSILSYTEKLEPIHTIDIKNATILKIYRIDWEVNKK